MRVFLKDYEEFGVAEHRQQLEQRVRLMRERKMFADALEKAAAAHTADLQAPAKRQAAEHVGAPQNPPPPLDMTSEKDRALLKEFAAALKEASPGSDQAGAVPSSSSSQQAAFQRAVSQAWRRVSQDPDLRARFTVSNSRGASTKEGRHAKAPLESSASGSTDPSSPLSPEQLARARAAFESFTKPSQQ